MGKIRVLLGVGICTAALIRVEAENPLPASPAPSLSNSSRARTHFNLLKATDLASVQGHKAHVSVYWQLLCDPYLHKSESSWSHVRHKCGGKARVAFRSNCGWISCENTDSASLEISDDFDPLNSTHAKALLEEAFEGLQNPRIAREVELQIAADTAVLQNLILKDSDLQHHTDL
uniref:Uncharacterized protein n=1 Tax=Chromera velia CCMP2878 TaxID=1169474 RepID=A0A0G4HTD6_9ALVE|mmetsp:Transcript_28855/g.56522  ORF Transcript_28855/g.56522 Transcript_28855/m.56522 type:complete len:175 (+) Transcript_28855:143-667(+)|eukprot:Cvel_31405.t1-p1 / transcript=Cvel_31405.t1 / gene=Cvel_31405 / organism=Chromera_velia_CCMP2878 / gene_product=hypothetical protein / transcript_product=hypothetical protein / location=Cvel_scaffold4676:1471-1992(-) / protein_length=174 / sequence_SO=supercontig / SO=protein_coding / is_pseudo=false